MPHNRLRTTLTHAGNGIGDRHVGHALAGVRSGFERAIGLIFSSWGFRPDRSISRPDATHCQAGPGARREVRSRLKLATFE